MAAVDGVGWVTKHYGYTCHPPLESIQPAVMLLSSSSDYTYLPQIGVAVYFNTILPLIIYNHFIFDLIKKVFYLLISDI